jgi:hypothetical protein
MARRSTVRRVEEWPSGDSLLEGDGFEPSVPRKAGCGPKLLLVPYVTVPIPPHRAHRHCQLKRPWYARRVGGAAARVEELLCSPIMLPRSTRAGRKRRSGSTKLTMRRLVVPVCLVVSSSQREDVRFAGERFGTSLQTEPWRNFSVPCFGGS